LFLNRFISLISAAVCSSSLYFALSPNGRQGSLLEAQDEKTVYVGLIEDDRRQLDHPGPKDVVPVTNRTITPAFEKNTSGWKAVGNLNQRIIWTVAFDGKNLAKVASEPISRAPSEKVSGPNNTHATLTPAADIPVIGKPDGRFSGNFGRVVRRPLVVVSQPNFTDPDEWKPRRVPDQVMTGVRSRFRNTFHHVRQCDSSGEALKTDWNYPDSEVAVIKSYGSNKGAFIIETKLRDNHCLYDVNGNDYQSLGGNQIFYAAPNRDVIYLGLQWQLVDAGDYDGDGRSEVIFYVAEGKDIDVESEGYVLFYDDFQHNVRLTWNNQ